MNSISELPDELSFAKIYLENRTARYRDAPWLTSDFDSSTWHIQSAKSSVIDWRVRLGKSGGILTDSRHASLLTTLKSWLIVQTHSDWTGRLSFAPQTELAVVRRAIHCVDYLLLRADALGLSSHGLMAITKNDVKAMLGEIASSRAISATIYKWPRRLSDLLRAKGRSLSEAETALIVKEVPFISADISEEDDRVTDLTDKEIIAARAWLWKQGRYVSNNNSDGYRYRLDCAAFATKFYTNTLGGIAIPHSSPPEFALLPGYRLQTEFPRARVVSANDIRMGHKQLNKYFSAVSSMMLLCDEGLPVPEPLRQNVADLKKHLELDLKGCGRFRTLPQSVVLPSIKSAIEYVLNFGDSLVDSYLKISKEAHKLNQSAGVFAHQNDISPYLDSKAASLGISHWAIDWNSLPEPESYPEPRLSSSGYYSQLRSKPGLWECLRVLYGAIQVIVGAVSARRGGELQDLIVGECLDISGSQMIFSNRKSGTAGFRQTEARPIPAIAVESIEMLERLQSGLVDIGAISHTTNVFACPANRGLSPLCAHESAKYNESIDFFCDWTQTPLDELGRRYYIRQHQLRRFFCMLFFWGGSFGGLETLRWFLGHTDVDHLWRYITESTPGAVLRGVAAEWAATSVMQRSPETEELRAILKEHFGTSNFECLESEVLEDYLLDLIEDDVMTVEPVSLGIGGRYQIAVVLRSKLVAS